MKLAKQFFTLLFSTICICTASAQEPIHDVIQQGTHADFSFSSESHRIEITSYPASGNALEVIDDGNSATVLYRYTPHEDFVGSDVFEIQEVISVVPFPVVKDYLFTIDVVESQVTASDDFVRISGDEEIIISPLANDESTASDMTISIAQVMFGFAEVNEDQSISYTPGEGDRDYIVYSALDMYGTSSTATIYISDDAAISQDNTSDAIALAAGTSEYIFLPDATFSVSGDSIANGSLEFVADDVYRYVSDASAEGNDEFSFVNEVGAVHTISVSVVSQYIDDGYVRDDIFHGAKNTLLQFNVKNNDINSQTVISDYSEELFHLGNGEFAYTPAPDSEGEVHFFYEADNGFDEPEQGSITLLIGNLEPTSNLTYALSTPINQPRVIEYNVPLGSEFFGIEDYPEHGELEVFDDGSSVSVGCDNEVQKLFALYTPNSEYSGDDSFILRYCASDNNYCKNISIAIDVVDTDVDACICVDDCVWPGDANNDGIVNMRDMLAIGGNLGASGPERDASPYAGIYDGTTAPSWGRTLPNGTNISHADADGNGQVATNDLDHVADNYGDVHTVVAPDLFAVKDIPFGFINDTDVEVGELKTIEIYAGSDDYPAVDIRGIAFSVSLPSASVDASTLQVKFIEDNYFVKNAPFVSMVHMSGNGLVHAGGIKTNALGSTGSGIIGELSFIVVEDAEGIRPELRRSTNGDEIITVELFDITYEGVDGKQYSLPSTSIDLKVKRASKEEAKDLSVNPNPTQDVAKITSLSKNSIIIDLEVYSMSGAIMHKSQPNSEQMLLDMTEWANGLYLIQAQTSQGLETMKLIKS